MGGVSPPFPSAWVSVGWRTLTGKWGMGVIMGALADGAWALSGKAGSISNFVFNLWLGQSTAWTWFSLCGYGSMLVKHAGEVL